MPDKTAWGELSQRVRGGLSPKMADLLKSLPVVDIPDLEYKGQPLAGQYAYGENGPYINYNPNASLPKDFIIMHESLHAWDAANPGVPLPAMDAEQRQRLYRRYYHRNPRFTNENHIPVSEAYASAGMAGVRGIPPGMSPSYRDVFTELTPGQIKAARMYARQINSDINGVPVQGVPAGRSSLFNAESDAKVGDVVTSGGKPHIVQEVIEYQKAGDALVSEGKLYSWEELVSDLASKPESLIIHTGKSLVIATKAPPGYGTQIPTSQIKFHKRS